MRGLHSVDGFQVEVADELLDLLQVIHIDVAELHTELEFEVFADVELDSRIRQVRKDQRVGIKLVSEKAPRVAQNLFVIGQALPLCSDLLLRLEVFLEHTKGGQLSHLVQIAAKVLLNLVDVVFDRINDQIELQVLELLLVRGQELH